MGSAQHPCGIRRLDCLSGDNAMTAHFTADQLAALSAKLDGDNVSKRQGAGRMMLSYIESHHAIREANRIFGFDGWSSETVDLRCIVENPGEITYLARVRITVYAGSRVLVREGVGAGHGKEQNIGQAHEKASKEAESDAQKRALRHFGDQFGLALYDKTQANVTNGNHQENAATPRAEPPPAKSTRDYQAPLEPQHAASRSGREEQRRAHDAELKAKESAVIKSSLLGHLKNLRPGSTTWPSDWNIYEQTAKLSRAQMVTSDRAIISHAERKRQEQHKEALAKQLEEAA
jgi:DNA recombination protein Rad52